MGHDVKMPIEEQVQKGIEYLSVRHKAKKFISYFQSFTNTYKPTSELKKIYDSAMCDNRIVGISIGTRPDCVEDEKLDFKAHNPSSL